MTEPQAGLVAPILVAFGVLVAFVLGCAAFIFKAHGYFTVRIEKPRFRQRVARELEEPKWSAPYLRGLDWALGRLDEIMGPINSWVGALQGFGFCLMLALVYSSVFLIFGWGLFEASGQIGTLDALPDWDREWRILFVFAAVLYGVVVFYVFRWIRTRALALAVAGAEVLAAAVAVAVAGAVVLAAALALAGAEAGAVALALAGALALARARAVAVAVAVAVALAGSGSLPGAVFGEADFVILLLWLALPIVNAGPDVISWWVSRWLGRHMQKTIGSVTAYSRKLVSFTGHVLLDFLAACFFFALLAWLMPRIVNSVNLLARLAASDLNLSLWGAGGVVCQTALDPWGEGAWPMMMLLSTLVPTALHFVMALLGLLVVFWLKLFRDPDVAAQLRAVPPDYCGEGQGGAVISQAIDDAASKLTWAWFSAIITGAVIVATLWVALHQIAYVSYAIDVGLDGFKRLMLWVAYGFNREPVGACLGA